jgi:hypothetical protein
MSVTNGSQFQEEYRAFLHRHHLNFDERLCLELIDIGRHSSAPTGLAVVGVKFTAHGNVKSVTPWEYLQAVARSVQDTWPMLH